MKYSLNILIVVTTIVLTGCANYNNFHKRKYTRGFFQPKTERLRASDDKKIESTPERVEVLAKSAESVRSPLRTASSKTTASQKIKDELDAREQEKSQYESAVLQEKEIDKVVLPGTERVSEKVSDSKRKSKRTSLTASERNARSTFVLGIVSISLLSAITATTIILAFTSGYFFMAFGLMRIPALLGFLGLFKGSFFYDKQKPLTGKYSKYRKKGLFLSFLTVVLWIVLFLV